MRCSNCQKELSENALFCPDCGMKAERSESSEQMPDPTVSLSPSADSSSGAGFVPASFDEGRDPASLFTAPEPVPAFPSYPPLPPLNFYDESDYYHIDATETPDFEAMRGISIVLIVLSALSFIGILFPMPLAIISLVKACSGAEERNPVIAKRTHGICRILVIISIIAIILILIGLAIWSYLWDPDMPARVS